MSSRSFQSIGRAVAGGVRLHARLAPGLDGIDGFSHVIVIYVLHKAERRPMKVHPQGHGDLPLVGLFATRSPHRPNPIGLRVCRVLGRRGATLRLEDFDAWPGSPVLDIKPYDDRDRVSRPRVPAWKRRLERR